MTSSETTTNRSARFFTLNGAPLLDQGRTTEFAARAQMLWLHTKVYAQGGENGLHAHPYEDHAFFVLAGEATFVDAEESTTTLGPCDGILIPRGVNYRFHSTGAVNLVMLRIGGGESSGDDEEVIYPKAMSIRAGVQPGTPENGTAPTILRPGATFGRS